MFNADDDGVLGFFVLIYLSYSIFVDFFAAKMGHFSWDYVASSLRLSILVFYSEDILVVLVCSIGMIWGSHIICSFLRVAEKV